MTGAMRQGGLSDVGALAHDHDPDRFAICLLVPARDREAAFALVAFNDSLAHAVAVGQQVGQQARDPAHARLASMVRLQWWRDIADGARPRHEVATPIGALLDAGTLDPARIHAMIDARQAALDPIPDRAAWLAMLAAGPGNLACAMGSATGAPAGSLDRIARAGAAYGAGASLRHARALIASGSAPFPADVLHAHALIPGMAPARASLSAFVAALAADGAALLAGRSPGSRNAGALHAVFARRDLARAAAGAIDTTATRSVGDRLALLAAQLSGRP